MPKPSNAIDNACIACVGYEYMEGQWREKGARFPAPLDVEIYEEAEMDLPPTSPQAASSPPPPGTGSSFAPSEWYTNLS